MQYSQEIIGTKLLRLKTPGKPIGVVNRFKFEQTYNSEDMVAAVQLGPVAMVAVLKTLNRTLWPMEPDELLNHYKIYGNAYRGKLTIHPVVQDWLD